MEMLKTTDILLSKSSEGFFFVCVVASLGTSIMMDIASNWYTWWLIHYHTPRSRERLARAEKQR